MKEHLKPCACKLRDAYDTSGVPRTFCRTVRRAAPAGEVKSIKLGAGGRPSLKRASKSAGAGPKPGDLSMSRLKPP